MMHREVIARRKVSVISVSIVLITVMLYISEAVKIIGLDNHFLGYLIHGFLLLLTTIILLKDLGTWSLAYKHSIIAGKLIINKISTREEKNLESIKIQDILYIGKKNEIPKEYSSIRNSKKYLCNRIGSEIYCCIYKSGNKIKKFNFQPSNLFIERIIKHGSLSCKLSKTV
ncbi:hypothetical protein K4H51_13080 [Clostridium chauvoei]|uniref:hypothetical protein n=1 Tax=Clostridium chauvoei TaxID=46867 RepID=UPI001C84724C|nr:hypothetical protein [Clostridium chauvoei]MBX7382593.1 hypothetical protein [Clostridium chauvoei]